MSLRKTVGSLTKEAAKQAASVARNPIGSGAAAAGLVKGTAEAGIDLVRGRLAGEQGEWHEDESLKVESMETEPAMTEPAKTQSAKPASGKPASSKAAPSKAASAKSATAKPASVEPTQVEPRQVKPTQVKPGPDLRDELPGPDLAPYLPPAPEDLPEPIVIEAEPAT